MVAPERRTRADVLAACAIAAAVALTGATIWLTSDARGTTSVTAVESAPPIEAADSVPQTLTTAWQTDSDVTRTPVVAGDVVVSGNGATVTGRDPATGEERWRYERDRPLCGLIGAWNTAVAVYPDGRGCGQVTQLDGATGERRAQRSSDADNPVVLGEDGTYVTSRGDTRLEMWRSDLVRTLEFGRVDAPVSPGVQPRTGCTFVSSASSSSRLAVLESCPDETGIRLSVLNPAPKDATEPQEYGSTVLDVPGGASTAVRVLAVSGDRTALYVPAQPDSPGAVVVYDGTATETARYPAPATISPGSVVTRAGQFFSWWTGSAVTTLRTTDLTPGWSFDDALGPGTSMGGQFLVPVDGGIAVVDPSTGARVRVIPVERTDGAPGTAITSAVVGSTIVEQRGTRLVALR